MANDSKYFEKNKYYKLTSPNNKEHKDFEDEDIFVLESIDKFNRLGVYLFFRSITKNGKTLGLFEDMFENETNSFRFEEITEKKYPEYFI